MEDILCVGVMGLVLAIILISMCRHAGDVDAEKERMDQARELLHLRLENEYLHMWQAEIRDKVEKMEPPHEYNVLYNRGWNDAVEEVRRCVE